MLLIYMLANAHYAQSNMIPDHLHTNSTSNMRISVTNKSVALLSQQRQGKFKHLLYMYVPPLQRLIVTTSISLLTIYGMKMAVIDATHQAILPNYHQQLQEQWYLGEEWHLLFLDRTHDGVL